MDIDIKLIPVKVTHQRMIFGELQRPEERLMTLGEKIDAYIGVFGSLPLSIRTVLQNLLIRGKIFVEFDDGSNERIELENRQHIMDAKEAVAALSIYSEVAETKTLLGRPITQRIVIADSRRRRGSSKTGQSPRKR